MQIIYNVILLTYLLVRVPASNCQDTHLEKKFRDAVEFWTETICTVPNTKTFIFHSIFANTTNVLRKFVDVLLRAASDHCDAIISVRSYALRSIHRYYYLRKNNTVETDDNTTECANPNVRATSEEYNDSSKIAERKALRKLVSIEGVFQQLWNIKKVDRTNKEYTVDIWNIHLIFLEDADYFEESLDYQTPFEWREGEHFIMLAIWKDVVEKTKNTESLIERILKKLWLQHRIQNVFFNEPFSNRSKSVVYSYNPFAKSNGTVLGKLEMIDVKSKRQMLYLLSTATYRRTMNMNGYRLNVSIFEQQTVKKISEKPRPRSIYEYSGGYNGSDGIFLGTVAKYMNFRVNIVEPLTPEKYGYQLPNGSFTGAIGDVVSHRVDACFASFFVKKYATDPSVIQFTMPVGSDKICIAVPKAHKIPKSMRIYQIFETSVWFCLVASQILVSLVWYYVQLFTPGRIEKLDLPTTAVQAYLINSGYPVKMPNACSERILVAGVFAGGLIMMATINSGLYNCLATDMYFKDIDRLSELDTSGLPILFSSFSIVDALGGDDDRDPSPLLNRLRGKMVYRHTQALREVALYRNASGFVRTYIYPLRKKSFVDEDGSQLIHLMRECPGEYYLAYLLPKNSILRERIDVTISRLNEAGLPAYWQKRTVEYQMLKSKTYVNGDRSENFVPYTLSDVQTCFFLLIIGLVLSAVVFLKEKRCLNRRIG